MVQPGTYIPPLFYTLSYPTCTADASAARRSMRVVSRAAASSDATWDGYQPHATEAVLDVGPPDERFPQRDRRLWGRLTLVGGVLLHTVRRPVDSGRCAGGGLGASLNFDCKR